MSQISTSIQQTRNNSHNLSIIRHKHSEMHKCTTINKAQAQVEKHT